MTLLSDWTLFFGHFHPVMVHLPIGAGVVAALFQLFLPSVHKKTLDWLWVFVSLTAGISCLLGWFLAQSGDYQTEAVSQHQWTAIAFFVLSSAYAFYRWNKFHFVDNQQISRGVSIVSVLLLTVTGHLGGNLTHGSDYLTAATPEPFRSWLGIAPSVTEKPVITDINEAAVYNDIIQPILKERCWSCHNATKIKGKLRMDEIPLLQKGGENGPVIVAGNAEKSELIRRIMLPENNDDHMPPEGKTPVSEDELVLLTWWINSGADFTKKVKETDGQTEAVTAALSKLTSAENLPPKTTPESSILSTPVAAADEAVLQRLRERNVLLTPLATNTNYLDVNLINAQVSDSLLVDLQQLSQQIVRLDLSGKTLPPSTVAFLNSCENLMRLRMAESSITDADIKQLKPLKHLAYITLFSTKTGDESLRHLSTFPSLQTIYCTDTQVTPEGIEAVRTANPKLIIRYQEAKFEEM